MKVPVIKRQYFKNLLNNQQRDGLEKYFRTEKMLPTRKDKLELAAKLEIDPLVLNKWFQSRRKAEKLAISAKNGAKNIS